MNKEDYSEKVIEILCEKIDELKKENDRLRQRCDIFTPSISFSKISTTPTIPVLLCDRCHSIPCMCPKPGLNSTTTTL
jgi:hypothetical protein